MKQFGWQVVGCSMPAMQRQERSGVMRSGRLAENTSRAAALRMDCSLSSIFLTGDTGQHGAAVVDLADNQSTD